MRCEDFFIAGVGAFLPEVSPLESVVDMNVHDSGRVALTEQRVVTVARNLSAPELAVLAAEEALRGAGLLATEIGRLIHAVSFHSGIELWSPACYIARVLGTDCVAYTVNALCSGALIGLEDAYRALRCDPTEGAVLVTAAEVFDTRVIDRYTGGTLLGDGGTAMILSREPGLFRVESISLRADPGLEQIGRGNTPFGAVRDGVIDLGARSQEFFRDVMPVDEYMRRLRTGLRTVVDESLRDAKTTMDEIAYVTVPFDGRKVLTDLYLATLGIDAGRTTWEFGRDVGHMGAGDSIAGLWSLLEDKRVSTGDKVLFLGVGSGFTFGAAVVERL